MRAMMIAVQTGPRFVMDWLNRESLQRAEAVSRLEQAQARLALAEHRLELAEVRSPINGIVLERMERGGQALPAGHLVMLVGDLAEMEVIADVLTQDALKLSEGSPVELTLASEPKALQGRVQRVEPQAFTKLSSLGVEQQRVNAIVTLEERPENLGVGYRVQARFLTGTSENALIVPRFSVLQDEEGTYYVFRVIDGKLSRTAVKLGLTSDLEMEVTEGLGEGDTIVRAPEATMKDGQAVSVRD
jgi:HlyD family secretion protein